MPLTMTSHVSTNPPGTAAAPGMVVQYGFRDEDDEDDGQDDRRRSSIFGKLQRQPSHKQRTGSGKLSTLLSGGPLGGGFGGSLHNPTANSLYQMDDSRGNNHHGENDSDDDGSVCSRASVAERAGKALKKFSGKLGFKKRRNKQHDDYEEYSSSEEEDDDEDADGEEEEESSEEDDSDEEEDDSDDDRSVASAFKRVSVKIGKALRVGRRDESSSEESEEESSEEEEEEEDPLPQQNHHLPPDIHPQSAHAHSHRQPRIPNHPGGNHNKPRRASSFGEEKVRQNLRRAVTADAAPRGGPKARRPTDIPPSSSNTRNAQKHRPRRHTSEGGARGMARRLEQDQQENHHHHHNHHHRSRRPASTNSNPFDRHHNKNHGNGPEADLGYGEEDLGYGETVPSEGGGRSLKRRSSVTKFNLEEKDKQEQDDGNVSELSDDDDSMDEESRRRSQAAFNPQAQYNKPVNIDPAAWSMNVTEEMWEEVTSDVEDDRSISKQRGWKMHVPKDLLGGGGANKNGSKSKSSKGRLRA